MVEKYRLLCYITTFLFSVSFLLPISNKQFVIFDASQIFTFLLLFAVYRFYLNKTPKAKNRRNNAMRRHPNPRMRVLIITV